MTSGVTVDADGVRFDLSPDGMPATVEYDDFDWYLKIGDVRYHLIPRLGNGSDGCRGLCPRDIE